jgi:hypothetical protein
MRAREWVSSHLLCLALALHPVDSKDLLEKRGHRTEIRKWSQGNVWPVDIYGINAVYLLNTNIYADAATKDREQVFGPF